MTFLTTHIRLNGIRELFGARPRKPKRVRANMQQRDRDVQALESRIVLSAASIATAGDQQQATVQSQPERHAGNSRIEALNSAIARLRANRLRNSLQSGVGTGVQVSTVREARLHRPQLVQRETTSASQNRTRMAAESGSPSRSMERNALQNSALLRSGTTASRSSALSRASIPTTVSVNSSSLLRSRIANAARQSHTTSTRLNTPTTTISTATSRLKTRTLQDSALYRSGQSLNSRSHEPQPSLTTTIRKQADSAVKRYVQSLENRVISSGIHQSESFESRISRNNAPIASRIARPSDFGLSSGSSSSAFDSFWASFNRNYSTNPWHAPVNGFDR